MYTYLPAPTNTQNKVSGSDPLMDYVNNLTAKAKQKQAAATPTTPYQGRGGGGPATATASPNLAPPPAPTAPTRTATDYSKLSTLNTTNDLNTAGQGAADAWWKDVHGGEDWANEHFKTGVMGTITDPRQAEVNAQLAKLQAGSTQGFTPQEMQAMREQGNADINGRLSSNMQQLGGIAAAHGIRGGAGAGLQQRALTQAQGESGTLARNLITQNAAQKNLMTDRYGNLLTGQQTTELGIEGKNNDLRNQELLGRTATPFQIASGVGAARAGGRADMLSQQEASLAKDYLNKLPTTTAKAQDTENAAGYTNKKAGLMRAYHDALSKGADDTTLKVIQEKIDALNDDNPEALANEQKDQKTKDTPRVGVRNSQSGSTTFLCTELSRQGLLPNNIYDAGTTFGNGYLKSNAAIGYALWARPLVKQMRKSIVVTALIAPVVICWAYHMAYKQGSYAKDNLLGKALFKIGVPICSLIGATYLAVRRLQRQRNRLVAHG